jgi:hypothetical protein
MLWLESVKAEEDEKKEGMKKESEAGKGWGGKSKR